MEIIQIVPRLPPAIDGVGDYAYLLACHLRAEHKINTVFIVCDTKRTSADTDPRQRREGSAALLDGFSVHQLSKRSSKELLHLISRQDMPATILLQYVGYGYQKRGCPVWLARGLQQWKKKAPLDSRLLTIFHELYASGPPTSPIYYISFIQRGIVRALQQLSATSFVSTFWTERLLLQNRKGTVLRQPIPSNIPLHETTPWFRAGNGPWNLLVFGQANSRFQTLRRHLPLLSELNRRNLLGRLTLLGAGAVTGSPDALLAQEAVPQHRLRLGGKMPPASLAEMFSQADFALSAYPAELACKSGSFMAALANGCPVVLTEEMRAEPLSAGVHFLSCDGTAKMIDSLINQIRSGVLDRISQNGREWYVSSCSWQVASGRFADVIKKL